MAWPKGTPRSKEVTRKIVRTRHRTLLKEAKEWYSGDETVPGGLGSIIHWDSLCLRRVRPNSRTRRAVSITCGKCGQDRWIQFDNLIKERRKPTFTGVCQSCWYTLTWAEKHRDRPLQRKVTPHGYVKVYLGMHHPMADKRGETYEHRLVMTKHLGRPLESSEHVHHLDGDKTNNDVANLELIGNQTHYLITKLVTENKRLETEVAHLRELLSRT